MVGIALDLVGAGVLANGLLAKPGVQMLRATGFWGADNPSVPLGFAEDRVDAAVGIAYLIAGFTVQTIGYVVLLGRDPDTSRSVGRALVATLLLAVVAAAALGAWRWVRPRFVRRRLVEMARYRIIDATTPPVREALPFAGTLTLWTAGGLGEPKAGSESDQQYVRRMFRVESQPGLSTGAE